MLTNSVLTAFNAAAESKGFEAEIAAVFSENFSIHGAFASMDAEFTEGANEGNDLPRAPDTTWSLSANLSLPLDNGAAIDVVATASYTDEYHVEVDNDPRGFEDSVTVIDASATYTSADESWDISIWGKNLDDKLYPVHHIDGSYGGATKIYAPPRTYGASVNYYWK